LDDDYSETKDSANALLAMFSLDAARAEIAVENELKSAESKSVQWKEEFKYIEAENRSTAFIEDETGGLYGELATVLVKRSEAAISLVQLLTEVEAVSKFHYEQLIAEAKEFVQLVADKKESLEGLSKRMVELKNRHMLAPTHAAQVQRAKKRVEQAEADAVEKLKDYYEKVQQSRAQQSGGSTDHWKFVEAERVAEETLRMLEKRIEHAMTYRMCQKIERGDYADVDYILAVYNTLKAGVDILKGVHGYAVKYLNNNNNTDSLRESEALRSTRHLLYLFDIVDKARDVHVERERTGGLKSANDKLHELLREHIQDLAKQNTAKDQYLQKYLLPEVRGVVELVETDIPMLNGILRDRTSDLSQYNKFVKRYRDKIYAIVEHNQKLFDRVRELHGKGKTPVHDDLLTILGLYEKARLQQQLYALARKSASTLFPKTLQTDRQAYDKWAKDSDFLAKVKKFVKEHAALFEHVKELSGSELLPKDLEVLRILLDPDFNGGWDLYLYMSARKLLGDGHPSGDGGEYDVEEMPVFLKEAERQLFEAADTPVEGQPAGEEPGQEGGGVDGEQPSGEESGQEGGGVDGWRGARPGRQRRGRGAAKWLRTTERVLNTIKGIRRRDRNVRAKVRKEGGGSPGASEERGSSALSENASAYAQDGSDDDP
jgi:hypothetical protein